jgi:hypothetical protein
MSTEIKAESLSTFEVTPDGMSFSLNFKRASGEAGSITLPTECLKQLVMTMPHIAAKALRKRYRNRTMRLVYAGSATTRRRPMLKRSSGF